MKTKTVEQLVGKMRLREVREALVSLCQDADTEARFRDLLDTEKEGESAGRAATPATIPGPGTRRGGATQAPALEPAGEPADEPAREPAREPTRETAREPTPEPAVEKCCTWCNKLYYDKDNGPRACNTHLGSLVIDDTAQIWTTGRATFRENTSSCQNEYPEGFMWSCCGMPYQKPLGNSLADGPENGCFSWRHEPKDENEEASEEGGVRGQKSS
ncbi:hypothetical protein F4779DRAFT_614408 [Xylariaceae sp. FL0662B]|nr:hypothetical protein F4779DRAFT_614408 [Xylariaceae sp. FL0662B]